MRKPGPKKTITDMRAYMSRKNRERRTAAKAAGICIECNESKARPGLTKCADCAAVNRMRKAA